MATDIEITNNALLYIGARQISGNSLAASTDTSREAVFAKQLYQQNKEWLLSAAIWHFAKSKETLINDGKPDDQCEWQYVYDTPDRFIKLIKFYPRLYDFTIFEQQRIYTNDAGPLEIDFIRDIDESDWPAWFQALFEFMWAGRLALPITRKAEIAQEMLRQYDDMFATTVVTNAEQVPTMSFGDNPFIDVR